MSRLRKKTPVDLSQADPRGRLDVLVSQCLDRIFGNHQEAAFRHGYRLLKPSIDAFLFYRLADVEIPGVPQAPFEIESRTKRARGPRVVKNAKKKPQPAKVQVIDIRPLSVEEKCS